MRKPSTNLCTMGSYTRTIPLTVGAFLAIVTSQSAQAASFNPFAFVTNVLASPSTGPNVNNDPTRDILLQSILIDGKPFNNFAVVSGAVLLQNDTYITAGGEVFGILNSGRGPNTTADSLAPEGASKPVETAADIVGSLGNLNLNSLVVTRESAATASFEVSFANAINKIFFWERGGSAGSSTFGDSDILVEALDDAHNVTASYHILRNQYSPAGYNISTRVERPNPLDPPLLNNGPFNIGSIGLSLQGPPTRTLRLTSTDNNRGPIGGTPPYYGDNGPDFKLIGGQAAVPGPLPLLGLGAAYGWSRQLRHRANRAR